MYLFFDTETTGLPRNYNAPVTDLNNWPRLVQIAWILQDKNGNTLSKECYIIRPVNFTIPVDASRIHRITHDHALKNGYSVVDILAKFSKNIDQSEYLVAHNISYDKNIVGSEFLRNGMTNKIPTKKHLCTMTKSINYCAIRNAYGFKYPKLDELHRKLFTCGFANAHDSLADITATAKCFWEMRRIGLI